ncbi:MAG: hypothetical protein AAGE76_10580 [Pseudomonadota bacterium]
MSDSSLSSGYAAAPADTGGVERPIKRRGLTGRKRAPWRVRYLAAGLILYPALAFYGPRGGHAEFYPFFDWDLFASAPAMFADAVLVVRAVDGEPLAEPQLFFDMADTFAAARRGDIRLAKLLDKMVIAHWHGKVDDVAAFNDIVRTTYLQDARSVSYDLAVIRYDAEERYRTGAIAKTIILQSFEKTADE